MGTLPLQPCTSSSYLWLEFPAHPKGVSNSRGQDPMGPKLPLPVIVPTKLLSTGKKCPRITLERRPQSTENKRSPWRRDKLLMVQPPSKSYRPSLSSTSTE